MQAFDHPFYQQVGNLVADHMTALIKAVRPIAEKAEVYPVEALAVIYNQMGRFALRLSEPLADGLVETPQEGEAARLQFETQFRVGIARSPRDALNIALGYEGDRPPSKN